MTGKGDTLRPVDWDKYSKNYDRIFGHTISSGSLREKMLSDSGVRREYDRLGPEFENHRESIRRNVATSSAIESGRTPESYLEDRNGQAERIQRKDGS